MATTPVDVNMLVRGNVRQAFTAAQDIQPVLSEGLEILIAEGIPPLTQVVALGNSWQMQDGTGSAATAALPTTTAMMSLSNLESQGGKSYVIEEFGSYQGVIDATQIDSSMLVAMLNKKGAAALTTGALVTAIQSLSGKGSYGGSATFRRGATVANDGWFVHGQDFASQSPTLAGQIFQANVCRVRGLYVVPPGGIFSWGVVKSAAAAAAQQFPLIRWHELQLNLG